MFGRQPQLQGPRRVPDVRPLLDLSSPSLSSASSFSSTYSDAHDDFSSPLNLSVVHKYARKPFNLMTVATSILRSLFPSLQSLLTPTCGWLTVPPVMIPSSARPGRRKVTGTFFGQKRGRVCFAVQENSRSDPVLLLELATPTSHLVKEMASGTVRILLECERSIPTTAGEKKKKSHRQRSLWDEPLWTMYCNGNKCGYAVSRPCTESDFHVLSAVQTVSVGAGVLPVAYTAAALPPPPHPLLERKGSCKKKDGWLCDGDGGSEVMYMRAKFERVVGGRDSEAFYMINPDCGRGSNSNNGGPELSIFLLRM